MRIGKFAKANELSADTVRHYMELGLIVPEKKGGQYDFDEKCQRDLTEVLGLKRMGFSLNEIKTLFLFKSFGKLTPYQEDEYYRAFFNNKHQSVEQEIEKLDEIKLRLEGKIQELSEKKFDKNYKMGIELKALGLLSCLKCQGELVLSNGNIDHNQVVDGTLSCHCGETYMIESGILKVENPYIQKQFQDQYDYDFIREYINVTDTAFLDNIYRGLQWVETKVDFSNFNHKVLLELGSGAGIFLRYIYDTLPEDCTYIAVDHDINRHVFVKDMLEMAGVKRNVIFVCTDFTRIPIKEKSIDVVVDFSGTTNYSFQSSDFLLELVNRYVKEKASLLGAYILFKNFAINSLVEKEYRKNFIFKNIIEGILKLSYEILDDKTSDYIDNGGVYENFFIEGEKIYTYMVTAKR